MLKCHTLCPNFTELPIYKCFFRPLNTNFSKFFAQIWHKKKKKKKRPCFFAFYGRSGEGNIKKIFLALREGVSVGIKLFVHFGTCEWVPCSAIGFGDRSCTRRWPLGFSLWSPLRSTRRRIPATCWRHWWTEPRPTSFLPTQGLDAQLRPHSMFLHCVQNKNISLLEWFLKQNITSMTCN